MQDELDRGLASQSRIAEDEISKLRATMQSQFELESNEKYNAAVAAMETLKAQALSAFATTFPLCMKEGM